MKINWKIRFKNRVFIVQLVTAVIMPVLAYYGVKLESFTTWSSLYDFAANVLSNPYVLLGMVVNFLFIVNDPTTKGYSDSNQAMSYTKVR